MFIINTINNKRPQRGRTIFIDKSELWLTHIYDNSNRLLKADRDAEQSGSSHDIINNYDKDGTFISLKRYGSADKLADNFTYTYYNGTNRLQSISPGAGRKDLWK